MASNDPSGTRNDAAGELESIAKLLTAAGFDEAAELAFKAAANLDLSDAELQKGWGGPLNGQQGRREAFAALVNAANPAAVVETGTFRGITTEWIAQNFKQPIHTCETDPRYFHQAKLKLAPFTQVYCELKDSRAFLRELSSMLPGDQPVLYYLDAHWAEDLPLREEIEIILNADDKAIVMIDDFAVPGDEGYRWDDYGPGKRLTLEIFEGTRAAEAHLFFPSLASTAETGAKRGCVVVTNNDALAAEIKQTGQFRGHLWSDWKIADLRTRLDEIERLNRDLRAELSEVRDAMSEQGRAFAAERATLLEHHDTLIRQRSALERDVTALSEAGKTAASDAERLRRELNDAHNATSLARDETALVREQTLRAHEETAQAREETGHAREETARQAAEFQAAAATLYARIEDQEKLHQRRIQQLAEELDNMQLEASALHSSLKDRDHQLAELVRQLKVMRAYVGIIE